MRRGGMAAAVVAAAVAAVVPVGPVLPRPASAQVARPAPAPPSESLLITARRATTWTDRGIDIVQLEGPVTIALDRATLTADAAVVWLADVPGAPSDQQQAHIALLGNAVIRQANATRSGDQLLADAMVRGTIRITADERVARDLTGSPLLVQAQRLRAAQVGQPELAPGVRLLPPEPQPLSPEDRPVTEPTPNGAGTDVPTTRPAPRTAPVAIRGDIETVTTPDGKLAAVASGGVVLFQERDNGDFIELQAQRAVVFTALDSFRRAADLGQVTRIEQAVTGAYLEGDVRVTYTPAAAARSGADQRLTADRVYYDFTTDRAVLTDAVLHTTDPGRSVPIIVRARTIRQLARTDDLAEFSADKVELTTSAFAVPSYSLRTDKAYVRQEDTGDERFGTRTTFDADHATFRAFGVPFFYLPAVGGSTDDAFPLRGVALENSRGFGTGVRTEWGLFETLGRRPPADLDATYRLDYFSDRGPAAGFDAEYGGGFITDTTKQPWNFEGEFTAYGAYDDGEDNLGRRRTRVDWEDEPRGRVRWEHQHFFPDDWQVQLRAAYVSDATFLEEWFEREFETSLPQETSAYFKRQTDTEAFTLLGTAQPNDVVTTADLQQEQFEVERLPELGYHRIGQSLLDDRFTFTSDNLVSGLRFNTGGAQVLRPDGTYADDQGFRASRGIVAGRPSLGLVGQPPLDLTAPPPVDDNTTYRGDFRQEVAAPFGVGEFKVLPYLVGRYTGYSDTPEDGSEDRFYGAAGVRINTMFWKVDDRPVSRLFDVNRIRHVVEPELHLYTSGTTLERDEVFVYDEQIDAIHDVSAAQVALRQRWQTKRGGGPQRQRTVDVFTLNVEANFYANQPPDEQLEPTGFRGLFFPSLPEASLPRNAVNADAAWRVTDTTVVLADAQQNLDEGELATAAVGFAAQRGERVSYFVGSRYIDELDSVIASIALDYQLTRKYWFTASQSYDFGDDEGTVGTNVSVRRNFDRFFAVVQVYYDAREDESGFRVNLFPEGLGAGLGSNTLGGLFGQR